MGITRPPYPTEFKQQMVELYRSGRTPGQLAKEFEPTEVTIRHWIAQADANEGHRPDVLTSTASATSCVVYVVKTSDFRLSGTYWQKPRPGSLGRPTWMPGGLHVRE